MKEERILNLNVERGYSNMIPPVNVSARKCTIVAMRKVLRITFIKSWWRTADVFLLTTLSNMAIFSLSINHIPM